MRPATQPSYCKRRPALSRKSVKMPRTRRIPAVAMLLALVCGGCQGADRPADRPQSAPSSPVASSPAAAPSVTAATIPAYLKKYTKSERRAYDAAVKDYRRFTAREASFMATGEATGEARRFYRKYTADWRSFWNTLREREASGIRIKGSGEMLRVRPSHIEADAAGGGTVELRVCGVSTGVRVFQRGSPVPQPSPSPTIVQVSMVKLPGDAWWRVLYLRVGAKC